MSIENPLWGARRIHGELLKLGFEVAQSSVAKYMVKRRGPPSQGWRTFWSNDLSDLGFQLVDQDALVFRIVNRRDNQVNPTCFECCIEDGY